MSSANTFKLRGLIVGFLMKSHGLSGSVPAVSTGHPTPPPPPHPRAGQCRAPAYLLLRLFETGTSELPQ